MASYNLSPVGNWFSTFGSNTAGSSSNAPLAGGLLWTYSAGTTTPLPTYTGSNGIIANTNPIVLGSDGRPTAEIWLTAGYAYKFVLQDSLGNPIPNGTYDNIVGINDTQSTAQPEWVYPGVGAVYSSVNSFSTTGNTSIYYQVGRRVQAYCTAGAVYGTVTASVYGGSSTSVSLLMDSGMALDSGLTVVNYAFLNSLHPSVPGVLPYNLGVTALTSTGAVNANGITSTSTVNAATNVVANQGFISSGGNNSLSAAAAGSTLTVGATSTVKSTSFGDAAAWCLIGCNTQSSTGTVTYSSTATSVGVTIASSVVTITYPGIYVINCSVEGTMPISTAGSLNLYIYKNGASFVGNGFAVSSGAGVLQEDVSVNAVISCAAGDTISTYAVITAASVNTATGVFSGFRIPGM